MFDISAMAVEETATIELLDPRTSEPLLNDEKQPCSVTVYGPGSKPFAAAQSAASNRALKRLRAKGRAAETTPEEDAAAKAAFLTAITVSFNGFIYGQGEHGPDMFRALYLDPKLGFITDQVNAGAGDWASFTKAAPSS